MLVTNTIERRILPMSAEVDQPRDKTENVGNEEIEMRRIKDSQETQIEEAKKDEALRVVKNATETQENGVLRHNINTGDEMTNAEGDAALRQRGDATDGRKTAQQPGMAEGKPGKASGERNRCTQCCHLSPGDVLVLVLVGPLKSYGIFYLEYLSLYRQGAGLTSWVAFTYALCLTLVGPIAGFLCDKADTRLLVSCAAIVGTAAYLGSAFAVNIPMLIFTYGFLLGIPACVNYTASITYTNKRIQQYPMLVNGLLTSGGSVGGMVLAPLVAFLVHNYTVRGALVVLAGLWLNQLPAGLLLRPLEKAQENSDHQITACQRQQRQGVPQACNISTVAQKDDLNSTGEVGEKSTKTLLHNIKNMMKPLVNIKYLAVLLFLFLTSLAHQGILGYLPAYANEIGFSSNDRSLFLTVISVSELIFRICIACFGEIVKVNKAMILGTIISICGICSTLLPLLANRILTMYIFAVIFGAFADTGFAFLGSLLHQCLEDRCLGTAFGLASTAFGVGIMIASVLFGYLQETTGTFRYTFHVAGGIQLVAAAVLILAWGNTICSHCRRKTYNVKSC